MPEDRRLDPVDEELKRELSTDVWLLVLMLLEVLDVEVVEVEVEVVVLEEEEDGEDREGSKER